jgi:hypothetical protein
LFLFGFVRQIIDKGLLGKDGVLVFDVGISPLSDERVRSERRAKLRALMAAFLEHVCVRHFLRFWCGSSRPSLCFISVYSSSASPIRFAH